MALKDLMDQVKDHPKIIAASLFGCLVVASIGAVLYVKINEQRTSLVDERIDRLELDSNHQKKVNKIVLNQIAALRSGYERLPVSLSNVRDELNYFSSIESIEKSRKDKLILLVKALDSDLKAVNLALEKSEAILSTFDDFLQASIAEQARQYDLALKHYLTAARSGNSDAKYRIATFYARGDGVAKNYAAAEDWYYKAALDGNVAARAELAQLWSSGLGVEKKPEKALALYYLLENDVPISVNEKISNLKRELTQKQLVEALEHIAEFSSPTEKLPNKSSNTDGEDAAGS